MEIETKAWLSQHSLQWIKPEELTDPEKAAKHISFSNHDMTGLGWTQIGTAKMELSLFSKEDMTKSAIQALEAEMANVRAEAAQKVAGLEEKKQQLMALEYNHG